MNHDIAFQITLIGVGATACVDVWALLRHRAFGQPLPDWALVGRWFGWLARGRVRHAGIAATPPLRGEAAIGWGAHYVIGIVFAAALPTLWGTDWLRRPTLLPALALGLATVAAPFLILQPAMGGGIAGSRTRRPAATRLQSLITHTVFGLGLYLSAVLLRSLTGDLS